MELLTEGNLCDYEFPLLIFQQPGTGRGIRLPQSIPKSYGHEISDDVDISHIWTSFPAWQAQLLSGPSEVQVMSGPLNGRPNLLRNLRYRLILRSVERNSAFPPPSAPQISRAVHYNSELQPPRFLLGSDLILEPNQAQAWNHPAPLSRQEVLAPQKKR